MEFNLEELKQRFLEAMDINYYVGFLDGCAAVVRVISNAFLNNSLAQIFHVSDEAAISFEN